MASLSIVIPTVGRDTLERAERSAARCGQRVVIVADDQPEVNADVHGRFGAAGLARNAGVELVDTTFVGFLDDDDELVPDAYRRALEAHADADLILHTAWHPQLGPIPRPGWLTEFANTTIAMTVRTSVFRSLGGFVAGFPFTFKGEDFELFRRFVDHGRAVVASPEVAYLIRPEEIDRR